MLWAGRFRHYASSTAIILTPRYHPSVLPVTAEGVMRDIIAEAQPLIRTQKVRQEASWLA
jgi:hypothetical protein